MGHEAVLDVMRDIAMADALSYWIVGGLTLVVFVVMRSMLPVKGLATVFAPAIFWGGLAGVYALSYWGFVASSEKSTNIAATSALGMIAALVVMVALTRLADALIRIRKPPVATPVPVQRNVRI
jgi:hypothetical protein